MAEGPEGALLVGILVDAVSEVMSVPGSDVEAMPSLGEDIRVDFVLGLAKAQGRVTILLDIDKVIQAQDLSDLRLLDGALESKQA